MPPTVETLAEQALGLSRGRRALLVEKLLESLAGQVSPAVERANLDEVRRRREAVQRGTSKLVEGKDALRRARVAVRA